MINVTENRFKFTKDNIKYLLLKYIKSKYTDIDISIKESLSTKSIYITFRKEDIHKTVRLSDHKNSSMTFHHITNRTKTNQVIGIFIKAIKILQSKAVYNKLKELEVNV